MEVLAASIRAHRDIVGLSVPGFAAPLTVLSLYADDTSVIVASERAIEAVFLVYASFKRGSGSRLNLGKCKGLWLGRGGVVQMPGADLLDFGAHQGVGCLHRA